MKILVAIKRVIDYNVKIRVKSDNTGVETANGESATGDPVSPPFHREVVQAIVFEAKKEPISTKDGKIN